MGNLYDRVKRYILDLGMIRPGEAVVAGVSGGADSLCLFQVLLRLSREIGFDLHVVHVHHGLRESAHGDLRFVEELCRKEQVPCSCVMVDAAARATDWGTGVEEAGRRLRYDAFEKTRAALETESGKPCRIAVAHHREDQAETVLFHLCRGTDLRGAGGMLPVSGQIIRPLINETRAGIEEFLTEQGMTWREDETNEDTSYTRNYLRREIMPRLREGVNPSAAENLARFAGVCAETERFLDKMTGEALKRCLLEDLPAEADAEPGSWRGPVLSLEALRMEDPLLQGRILYTCLARRAGQRKDLSAVHVDAMRGLCGGETDGSLSLPGRMTFVRSGGALFFYKKTDMKPLSRENKGRAQEISKASLARDLRKYGTVFPLSETEYECRVFEFDGDLSAIPQNEYTKWFDYDKIGMFPVFRTRLAGDRMTLSAGSHEGAFHSVKLKKVMIDGKIPAQIRGEIVLPFCENEALWVPGLRMGDRFRITSGTGRILEISWRPDTL